MAVTITETGYIVNEAGPGDNPRETEYFEHFVPREVDSGTSITSWEITGDVPVGVTIDSGGTISGVVEAMWNQPSCVPKKEHAYPELDCRNFPDKNGRYANDSYDFTFTTTVFWVDSSPDPVERSTSVSHTITLVKSLDLDRDLLFRELLDGALGREPYHCSYPGPSTQAQCEVIGGAWDAEHQRCSIHTPQTSGDCSSVGGSWEDGRCNLITVKTREECETIGGTWTKNTLVYNGVTYDNSADYLSAVKGSS